MAVVFVGHVLSESTLWTQRFIEIISNLRVLPHLMSAEQRDFWDFGGPFLVGAHHCIQPGVDVETSTKAKRLGNYSSLDLSWFIINQPLTNQPTTDILIWPDISCILWPCLTKLSHWIQVALPRHISCRELPRPGFVQPPGIAFSNYAGATKASLVIGDPMILADWSNLYITIYIYIYGNISVDIGSIYIYPFIIISCHVQFMSFPVMS